MQEAKQMTLPDAADLIEFRDAVPILVYDQNGNEIEVVDFKAVHAVLGSGTRIDNWFKRLVDTYDFKKGEDFITLEYDPMKKADWDKIIANGNKTTVTYYMTLDMAKEVCMLNKTPIGKRVRRYFIFAEKFARKLDEEGLKLAWKQEVSQVNAKLGLAQEAHRNVLDNSAQQLEGIAKHLGYKGVNIMEAALKKKGESHDIHAEVSEYDKVEPQWKLLARRTLIKAKALVERKEYKELAGVILGAYDDMKRADNKVGTFRGDFDMPEDATAKILAKWKP